MSEETNIHLEGSPWFWKLFGAALIGFSSVLLMIILNAINSNTLSIRAELTTSITENKRQHDIDVSKLRDQLKELEVKIAASEEFKLAIKDKVNSLDILIKEKNALFDTTVAAIRVSDKEFRDKILKIEEKMLKLEEKLINTAK